MQGDIDSQLEKMAYDEKMREFWDREAQLGTAERKGIDLGKKTTAVNLKNMGFSAADIAKATGLPEAEIEKL